MTRPRSGNIPAPIAWWISICTRAMRGLAVAYMEARDQAAELTPADRCVKSLMQSVSAEPQQKTL